MSVVGIIQERARKVSLKVPCARGEPGKLLTDKPRLTYWLNKRSCVVGATKIRIATPDWPTGQDPAKMYHNISLARGMRYLSRASVDITDI